MTKGGPVVCVVGPTASGKSAIADSLACRLGSVVISVDAMQVYRGMDIGTAKTPPSQRKAPLLMVDIAHPGEDYSVQRFQADARMYVDDALAKGLTPVLCGGTGLYLNAVVDNMEFPSGQLGSQRRQAYEQLAKELGPVGLHELLRERDPKSADAIHPNNVRRVVRALELLDEGVSYAKHHEGLHRRQSVYDARIWGLTMSRERLYKRIDARVDEMFDNGLVEEVLRLADNGLRDSKTARQAIGYKEVLDTIDGICTAEEAREAVKMRTRRYAKRQLSWFRHDERVRWLDLDMIDDKQAVETILCDLRESDGQV